MSGSIEFVDVHKRYRIYRRRYQSIKELIVHRRLGEWHDHWALRGVNLQVNPGTTLGLIGPNGAGKSTALKLMARILAPDRGRVQMRGKVSGLLELGAGFHIDYSGRENVFLNASLLGLTRRDIQHRFDSIVAFAELEKQIDDPLRTYSSGMSMRLAFSVAIHVDPEVLLIDEILAVGDQSFQDKCLRHVKQFQAGGGTIVMVSHNLASVQEMCEEAAWVEDGEVLEIGAPPRVVNAYVNHVRRREELVHSSRAVQAEAGGRPAELGLARLLNERQEPVGILEIGAPLMVEIPYLVYRRVEEPVFLLQLFRNDGTYVYGTNNMVEGVRVPSLQHDGSIRFHYRSLGLLPGTYRLSIVLYEGSSLDTPIDHQDRRYSFQVHGPPFEQGLVRLDHDWDVRAADIDSRASTTGSMDRSA